MGSQAQQHRREIGIARHDNKLAEAGFVPQTIHDIHDHDRIGGTFSCLR